MARLIEVIDDLSRLSKVGVHVDVKDNTLIIKDTIWEVIIPKIAATKPIK
ncbi:hypothetical protein MYX76_08735 [Desulfobacterota bacterium AH_259_B03_O07]|nr:hypothetical protein [Desulfobacterota bacterium AH_259_B03_O07]